MDETEEKVGISNPFGSGKPATWGWGGKFSTLNEGEAVLLPPFLALHAQKHNPWLVRLADGENSIALAEQQVNAAQGVLDLRKQELQAAMAGVEKAQRSLDQAKANVKARNDAEAEARQRLADQAAAADKEAHERALAAEKLRKK